MDASQIIGHLKVPFTFEERPAPVEGDLRVTWRVPLLLLILRYCCRKNRSSLRRVHLIDWALRSPEFGKKLIVALHAGTRKGDILLRFDPSVNRALEFAAAEGLLWFPAGDRVELTEKGAALTDQLKVLEGAWEQEKEYLRKIGKQVTENWVTNLTSFSPAIWA